VEQVWSVPYEERARAAREWARVYRLQPASLDTFRVCLLGVDLQNTFCLPDFQLFVAGRSGRGAVEDNVRLCRFVYHNLEVITEILPTLDTHTAMQIFHQIFWVDGSGEHPAPFTLISPEDVRSGSWRVNPEVAFGVGQGVSGSLEKHALHYVERLSESGKYPLLIWPYHSMLGGIGHALVSAVEEAAFFHCSARNSQTRFEVKGGHPLTEHYSALQPEVIDTYGGRPIAEKNQRLIERLLSFDAVIVAGQAKSHCVAWTVDDLLREINTRDPALARKIYLLEDCTSPVVVPGSDFTEQADVAFQRFAEAGIHVVRSTDPVESWPGMRF
jgi:nicotinamidase-related amidase